jgi:uncharacterized membrane protein
MVTLYTLLLTLHILLVVGWLGAGVTLQVLALRVSSAGEGALAPFGDQLAWFGERWFPAVSGLTGLMGVLLWIDGPWEFGDVWILIAAVGWIISSAVGATQLGPRALKLRDAPDAATLQEFRTIARVDSVLLVLIVADMVMKPWA